MIAIALACNPDLLIADEPTTALDVTLQAQILDLLRELKGSSSAILLITHDLGVVAEVCDEVAVMYAGEIVERATVEALFDKPEHPYTDVGQMGSDAAHRPARPSGLHDRGRAARRETSYPSWLSLPCALSAVTNACEAAPPPFVAVGTGHWSRCIRAPLESLVT